MLARNFAKLILKNLHFEITEKDISALVQQYGKVNSLSLPKKNPNLIKGIAYIDYEREVDRDTASQKLDGYKLKGRNIKTEIVRDTRGDIYDRPILEPRTIVDPNRVTVIGSQDRVQKDIFS